MKKLLFLLSFVLTIVGFSLNANGQQTVFDPCTRTICGNFVSAQGGCIECGEADRNCSPYIFAVPLELQEIIPK